MKHRSTGSPAAPEYLPPPPCTSRPKQHYSLFKITIWSHHSVHTIWVLTWLVLFSQQTAHFWDGTFSVSTLFRLHTFQTAHYSVSTLFRQHTFSQYTLQTALFCHTQKRFMRKQQYAINQKQEYIIFWYNRVWKYFTNLTGGSQKIQKGY
jgi:hypothetical protein